MTHSLDVPACMKLMTADYSENPARMEQAAEALSGMSAQVSRGCAEALNALCEAYVDSTRETFYTVRRSDLFLPGVFERLQQKHAELIQLQDPTADEVKEREGIGELLKNKQLQQLQNVGKVAEYFRTKNLNPPALSPIMAQIEVVKSSGRR